MRKISSVLTLILVVCLSIGGVSAAWVYATGDAVGAFKDFLVSMGTWEFGYTISFVNNGENLITPINVTDNSQEFVIMNSTGTGINNVVNTDAKTAAQKAETDMGDGYEFSHWINAGSTRIDKIDAGNTEDVTLYPSFSDIYTAIFVDLEGNVLNWTTFSANNAGYNKVKTLGNSVTAPDLTSQSMNFVSWEVKETDADGNNVASYALSDLNASNFGKTNIGKTDITIYPVYQYNGTASLVPIDSDGDGDTDYYQVDGYSGGTGSNIVDIPNNVNGLETTQINASAFSSFDDLYAVKIPCTVTTVENKAFADKSWTSWGRDTVTLYVELDLSDPNNLETVKNNDWTNALDGDNSTTTDLTLTDNWDYNMGDGSRIFFLDENGKVINEGYWELNTSYVWEYHSHAYVCNSSYSCSLSHRQNDTDYIKDTTRTNIDRKYWNDTYQ